MGWKLLYLALLRVLLASELKRSFRADFEHQCRESSIAAYLGLGFVSQDVAGK